MNDLTGTGYPAEPQTLAESMVTLRARVPDGAFTASILGTERSGNGIVIGADGLILTIGYLITEASDVWLTTHDGREFAGHALAYDQVTGFGLVLPLGSLNIAPLTLGESAALDPGTSACVITHPNLGAPLPVQIGARREFAGAWEYLLDDAIYTLPAHAHWSGAALIDAAGRLVGLGSLLVREIVGGTESDVNLFVPTDLLKPILSDLRMSGRASRQPRPWLGMYTSQQQGNVIVAGIIEGGPAQQADIREGDQIREVGSREVSSMAEFYRAVWQSGEAGVVVPLTTSRAGKPARVLVRTVDRSELLWRPVSH